MKDTAVLQHKAEWLKTRLESHYGIPKWRQPLPVLDELVSTILSQNTNDRNRDVAFDQLRAKFPTWEMVRDAKPDEVITAVKSAGLANQKGPRIQAVLKQITEQNGSLDVSFLEKMEKEQIREWLLGFKGVGPKTAAIVMQFSMGIPAFPVDTHIYRVSGRFGLRPSKMNADSAHDWLEGLFSPDDYESVHLNIIRLGREICQARTPQCDKCPVQEKCDYFNTKE